MHALEPRLHFVLVGVPKAGTTSLHAALSRHPELTLPRGKEAPFFLTHPPDPGTWRRFAREVFPRPWRRLGKITPQYWFHLGMPEILVRAFPEARILILLRDPVQRFYSEYAMYVRRGAIREPLSVFLSRALDPEALYRARRTPLTGEHHPGAHFLVAGEYAPRIQAYQARFAHVGVFFFEDLIRGPESTLAAIQRFLGVPVRALPFPREHAGEVGSIHRWVARALGVARAFPPARWVGKVLLGQRRHDLNWFIQTRTVRAAPPPLDPESLERLRAYYTPHVEALTALLGRRPPWEGFR